MMILDEPSPILFQFVKISYNFETLSNRMESDPVAPIEVSEYVKTAPFWSTNPTTLPNVAEVQAFLSSVDPKIYSYSEVAIATFSELRSHALTRVTLCNTTVSKLQDHWGLIQKVGGGAVASIIVDLHDVVDAVNALKHDPLAPVSGTVVNISNVVEAVAGATVAIAHQGEIVVDLLDKVGVDSKVVAEISSAIDVVVDVAKKVDDVAEKVEKIAVQIEQVEVKCCLWWHRKKKV
jgi:hypothetical protein